MFRFGFRLAAFLVVFAVSAPLAVSQSPEYRFVLLPAPEGCQSYASLSMLDEAGRTVGFVSCDDFATQQAVLWTHDEMIELGAFGGPSSQAYGVMGGDAVVGTAETADEYDSDVYVTRAFLWNGERLTDLGTLGGRLGAAAAVNRRHVIVGACEADNEDPALGRAPMRACVWEDGGVRDLGDLGGPEAAAYDVNERGWIVGDSDVRPLPSAPGFERHAFLHDGIAMRDLGVLGGLASSAQALNNRGEVVGWSLTGESSPNGYPVQHAFVWRGQALRDLVSLGGPMSAALDINDRGQIVGWSHVFLANGALETRAVLWSGGEIVDLNDVVRGAEGWRLEQAVAINGRGAIVVVATGEQGYRTALLAPVVFRGQRSKSRFARGE